MTSMTLDELKQIVQTNGSLEGWDFSRIRAERTPAPWDYVDVVRKYLKPQDRVLDVGTGGGEIFFSLAPYFREGVGIDQQLKMIKAAERNKSTLSIDNVSLLRMEANDLQFEAESFDVVLAKHLHVYVNEMMRVLRPGGYFITQMVGKYTENNFLEAFGWERASSGPDWWQTVAEVAEEFRSYDCRILAQAEYNVPYWFQDVESFMFFIMSVPWPETIEVEKHWKDINRILDMYQTEKGIETNEQRGLLIVQKR